MSGIDRYLSPSGSGKRGRSNSSPEQLGNFKKVIKGSEKMVFDVGEMLKEMDKLLDKKLERMSTKEDINLLIKEISDLRDENRELKKHVSELKNENKVLVSRLNDLEDRSRRNNLIFKGVKHGLKFNAIEVVKQFCIDILGASNDIFINRAHALGKNILNGPIIAHFPYDSDIHYVLQNTNKLKGTNVVIHRDFSKTTRFVRGKLFQIKKKINDFAPDKVVRLNRNALMFEGTIFTIEEGKLKAGQEEGFHKLSSLLGKDVTEWENKIFKRIDGSEQE